MKLKHISAKQAGELLGVSKTTIYKMIESKRLGAVKIGHRLWIPLDAVEAMAQARKPQEDIFLDYSGKAIWCEGETD